MLNFFGAFLITYIFLFSMVFVYWLSFGIFFKKFLLVFLDHGLQTMTVFWLCILELFSYWSLISPFNPSAPEFDVSELETLFSATVPNSANSLGGKSGGRRKSVGSKADRVNLVIWLRIYCCALENIFFLKKDIHVCYTFLHLLGDNCFSYDLFSNWKFINFLLSVDGNISFSLGSYSG